MFKFLKQIFQCIICERSIILKSERRIHTIKLKKTHQILVLILTIFLLSILTGFFFNGIRLYKKANKKQNMINSIMQSEDSARSELKTMIDQLDALNEYLSTVKKTNTIIAKNPEKEYKNDKNSSNNNHDEMLDQSTKEEDSFFETIEIPENPVLASQDKPDLNAISNSSANIQQGSVLHLSSELKKKIDQSYKFIEGRYIYLVNLLSKINLYNCQGVNSSWIARTFADAENLVSSAFGAKDGDRLIKIIKMKICSKGVIQKLENDYKLMQKIPDQKIEFIKTLPKLEKIVENIPLGTPMHGRMSSGMGHRVDPVTRKSGVFHAGQDIAAPIGTPIYTKATGTVIRSGWFSGYGLCVDIKHDFGIITRYGHLKSSLVRVGQSVIDGSMIAKEGNSGKSTGPHLHYEIRVNNAPINPKKFMFVKK